MSSFPEDVMAESDRKTALRGGYEIAKRGYEPRKVQGGYVPQASAAPITPPKGGSAIKPPKR
jgi:hypothetical protein